MLVLIERPTFGDSSAREFAEAWMDRCFITGLASVDVRASFDAAWGEPAPAAPSGSVRQAGRSRYGRRGRPRYDRVGHLPGLRTRRAVGPSFKYTLSMGR